MNFHLAFTPKPFAQQISHQQKLFLIGSCFTENIGARLKQHKFSILENPHGILFNPVSIVHAMRSYLANKRYSEPDLFYQNECWNSWEHHSRFSHPDKTICLQNINQSQQQAHQFLQTADWVMITLGSAFAYLLNGQQDVTDDKPAEGTVVANCHKVPTDKFKKKLFSAGEIKTLLQQLHEELIRFNPGIKIIFTISPVRHLRDGLVENNHSKAMLVQAVHELTDTAENIFYFPAYELVIDDLRDYRFYAEDLVHPNYAATNYVWEKFIAAGISESSQKLMKEINAINAAKSHKPFNRTSVQHKKFLQLHLEKVQELSRQYPFINLDEEKAYFDAGDSAASEDSSGD